MQRVSPRGAQTKLARSRHLSRAPLREAVLDIQFDQHAALDKVKAFGANVGSPFHKSSNIWQALVGFQVGDVFGAMPNASQLQLGTRFDSNDPPCVMQCRINGFSFSRLTPYENWESLRDMARPWFQRFGDAVAPIAVSRLALRYINALRFPLPIDSFDRYLTSPPQVPEALPQTVAGFFSRTVIVDSKSTTIAVVAQALEEQGAPTSVTDTSVAVILDIDVFRNVRIESRDFDSIWTILQALRDYKNQIFFEYLT